MSENNTGDRVVVTLNGAYVTGPSGEVHAAPGNGDWVWRVRGRRRRPRWADRVEAAPSDGGVVAAYNEKFLPEGRWRLDGGANPWDAIAEWLEGGE
jgi:hypothetical protein